MYLLLPLTINTVTNTKCLKCPMRNPSPQTNDVETQIKECMKTCEFAIHYHGKMASCGTLKVCITHTALPIPFYLYSPSHCPNLPSLTPTNLPSPQPTFPFPKPPPLLCYIVLQSFMQQLVILIHTTHLSRLSLRV